MKRTDAAGHADNLFTNGNPTLGVPATVVDDSWLNNVQEEICFVIEEAGIALDGEDQTQLYDAIAAMIAAVSSVDFGTEADLASDTTTDLGAAGSHVVRITGTNAITSFGSSASTDQPIYLIRFSAALTLTHNGTSLILPGAANITTFAGDAAIVQYLGSGNWRVLQYQKSSGFAIVTTGTTASLASATTTDLGGTGVFSVAITGTTTITGFGSSASVTNPIYFIRFTGALTLTHNGTSLIIPGGQNVLTVAGDSAIVEYLGSGNWRVLEYYRADGRTLSFLGADTTIASATTTTLTQASNVWNITGTTTITGFGSSASVTNPIYFIRFTGALTLTHNAASLILPRAANITTAAGDAAVMLYLGSGNWRCLHYMKTSGDSLITRAGAELSYTVASGTTSPAYTGGDWRTVLINTEDSDPSGIVSISSNQFTPIAGKYMVIATVTAKDRDKTQRLRLYNATAASQHRLGSTYDDWNSALGMGFQMFHAFFTATGAQAFEIQIYPESNMDAYSGSTLGSLSEVFTMITLIRISD